MSISGKKILLAGAALVAATLIHSAAAHAQVLVNGGDQAVNAGNGGITFQSDHAANVASGTTINGAVLTNTPGTGAVNFSGGVNSFSAAVAAIRAINISDATVSTSNANFEAGAINFVSGGSMTLNATNNITSNVNFSAPGGSLTFAAGSSYAGIITGNNSGIVNFNVPYTIADSAHIGTGSNAISELHIAGGMTGTLLNRIYANNVSLDGAGTTTFGLGLSGHLNLNHAGAIAELSNNANMDGNVTAIAPTSGTLRFLGNANISGTVNAGTINVAGVSNTTAVMTGAVTANALSITDNGNVAFGNGGTIATAVNTASTGIISNTGGTLTLTGGVTAANATLHVGTTGSVSLGAASTVSALSKTGAGASTITGTLVATTTSMTGGGSLAAANTTLGAITFNGAGGTISSGTGITSITGATGLTGNGEVSAQVTNIAVTNNSTANGVITVSNAASTLSGATLASGSTLNFGGSSIGAVTGAGSTLTINRAGAQSVGAVGTAGNALSVLNLSGSGTKTLSAPVYATTTNIGAVTVDASASFNGNIHFTSTGTLNFAHNAGATGNGNVTTSANNQGTINFAGNSAVDGTVGADGAALSALIINSGAGQNVAIGGATHIATVRFTSAGTLNLNAGGNVIGTIDKQGANESVVNATTGTTAIGTVTVANGGTLDLNGANVTVTGATTLGTGATLSFDGTSLGSVAGTGATLNLDGAVQTAGTIGTAGNKLTAVNFQGTGAKTVTGSIYATNTNLGAHNVTVNGTAVDSHVNFSNDTTLHFGAAGSAITGNVTTATAGQGRLTYTGGLNITGNVARLHTFDVTNTVGITGNMTAADNMNVGINNMNLTGTFATTANTQLTYRVNTPTTSGKITAGGEATVVSGTRVNMIVDTNVYVSQGQEFILIDGAESGGHVETLAAGNLTTTNTALLHFKQKITDTNNLVVYADRLQMNVAATIPNNQSVGAALEKIGGSSDPDIYALQVALGKLDTVQQVEEKLATLIPNVSGAATSSIVSVGTSTGSIMNTRVASLRAGESYGSGMAAGNGAEGGHFWGQVFGSTADQDRRHRIAGYDADTYGTVLGVDTEFWDNIRTGLAFAYASTDVSGHDANRTQTDINSYQLSLYSDYDLPDSYYLTGQISYMYSDIDSTRYNVAQLAGNNAHADYSSNQYSIRSEVGREWRVDGTRFSLTPAGTFNYTYVDVEGYSERGAGGLSLRDVASDDLQILEFGGKLKVEAKFEDHAGGSITPNLHAGYAYDVIGDKVATSARFAGGGTAFKTEGFEPAQHTLSGGAGLTWKTASDFELNLNYDYEYKSDYEAHSGFVRAGYKF